jgi:hypothetical protein
VDILQIKLLIKGNDKGVATVEALLGVDICIRAGALVSVLGPGG